MNSQQTIELLLQLLRWFLISAGVGLPLLFCGYVLVTPTYNLEATWQNFQMRRRPHRALKDRHFKGLPKRIRICKVICFFGLLLFLWLALLQFHVDVPAIFGHITK